MRKLITLKYFKLNILNFLLLNVKTSGHCTLILYQRKVLVCLSV